MSTKSTTKSKFSFKVTVEKKVTSYGGTEYAVTTEGSGFVGEAEGSNLSYTFKEAYEDMMEKLAAGCFQQEQ